MARQCGADFYSIRLLELSAIRTVLKGARLFEGVLQ
jgi:hypothetical protein